MSQEAFPDLVDWHHRAPGDHCYICDTPPSAGRQLNIEHVVPKWLAPSAATRPTAAVCKRCEAHTRDLERDFKNEISFRMGSEHRLWSAFRQHVLKNPHPKSVPERMREIGKTQWIEVDGALKRGRTDPSPIYRGIDKMTRGLFRALAGQRLMAAPTTVTFLALDDFLRTDRSPVRCFRVGADLDVLVEGHDQEPGMPLFRFRFARRLAVAAHAGPSPSPGAHPVRI